MVSFYLFLPVVYLVGITDLWPDFMRIIGHNSINLHQISTKVGTEIHFLKSLLCVPSFSFIWSMHLFFMAEFAKCAKWRKTKKKKCHFICISGLAGAIFLCILPYLVGISAANLIGQIRDHQANPVYLWCVHRLLGLHDTLPCVLYRLYTSSLCVHCAFCNKSERHNYQANKWQWNISSVVQQTLGYPNHLGLRKL